MGTYLNPGNEEFAADAFRNEIYVDKTEMIMYLNSIVMTAQKFVSVSRPRRFGKTMAANLLCAYYERSIDSRRLFEKTRLSECKPIRIGKSDISWDTYLQKFDVIRVVMTDFIKKNKPVEDSLNLLTKRVLKDLHREYPDTDYDPDDLAYSMNEFYQDSRIPFVIIIDEWDAVFRIRKSDSNGQLLYLDFLRDWLKDKKYVALAYITGILPIKKYGEHSALNMFDEYSMVSPMQLAPYTGFTDDEVKVLCTNYGRDYEAVKSWYDGYIVSDAIPPDPNYKKQSIKGGNKPYRYAIYSPLSVVSAMRNGIIRNYWNSTESYEALAEYIRRDFDGLKSTIALLMDGGRTKINISTYQNDMTTFRNRDDVLTLLIHLGYLGYDDETCQVFIPNKEILDVFRASTGTDEWSETFQSFEKSQELLKATWDGEDDRVAEILEWFHDQTSNRTYNDEAALSYAVQMAYYAAQKYYTTVLELDTGKGYADIVYLPAPKYSDRPALLVELKSGKTARTAMDQIRARRYPDRLEHYKGNILLVGINYDREVRNSDDGFKHHSCVIEKA